MKIIQITNSLGNGGAEKFMVELSNELSKRNDVLICTVKPNEDWMIQSHRVNTSVKNNCLYWTKKYSFNNFISLFRYVKKEKPDIVHVHASVIAIYLLIFPLFFSKIKFYQTIHSKKSDAYTKLFTWFNIIPFLRLKWKHICVSEAIFKDFSKSYPSLFFLTIENGVMKPQISIIYKDAQKEIKTYTQGNGKLLIAVGNYSDVKRYDELVLLLSEIELDFPGLSLIILGEEASDEKLNYKKVKKLKAKNTHLLGLKSNVADYMSLSDALIISSNLEGMPLVILEAMALGKPIITTPAGGIVDMVKNKVNGFVSENLSKASLKASLLGYLKCPTEELKAISKNNLDKYQKQYSMDICAKNYLKLYKN